MLPIFRASICTKALINAGVNRLVYHIAYRMDDHALEFLQAAQYRIMHLEYTPNHHPS
jgi:deoxycytidylate deaminase